MNKQKTWIAATLVGVSIGFSPLAGAAGEAPAEAPGQSAGSFAGDAVVTAKVKAALLKEQATQSLSIKVETTKGVVHLTGKADDSAQIDSALRTARSVNGVQDVKNDIQLKKAPQ